MPAYEYHCNSCGKDFIVYLSLKEFEKSPIITCEYCKSDQVTKNLSSFFTKTSKKS